MKSSSAWEGYKGFTVIFNVTCLITNPNGVLVCCMLAKFAQIGYPETTE